MSSPLNAYKSVPLYPTKRNIEYRNDVLQRCDKDKEYRRTVVEACKRDTMYFFATFCWLYEPRPTPKVIPFIPWPHQEPGIRMLDKVWGKQDCLFDKSRGEGATWIVLLRMLKSWLFEDMFAGGVASRHLQAIDRRDDMDALLPKLDWQLTMLPVWMVPPFRRSFSDEHILANHENRSTIAGYASTDDLGTGGRKTVWFWDELAKFPPGRDQAALDSTEPTSECRIMVSTFKGTTNAYYRLIRDPGETPVVVLDWKDNPTRNRSLFVVDGKLPKAVKPSKYGPVPPEFIKTWPQTEAALVARGYEFDDETVMSPWYVDRCLRPGSTPQSMAQEYDRNPEGTESVYFSAKRIKQLKDKCCIPPSMKVHLSYDPETLEPRGEVSRDGDLLLWVPKDANGEPALRGDYVVGCDIAHGLGGTNASNSAAIVLDRRTGEQVAEFVTRQMTPSKFAHFSIALCKYFNSAQLNFEANGPTGRGFSESVKGRYNRVWVREVKEERSRKKTKKLGWFSHYDKSEVLGGVAGGGLREAIYDGNCVIRSSALLDECGQYIIDDQGKTIHAKQRTPDDNTSKGENHGDRVIAAAVAWLCLKDRRPAKKEESVAHAPPGSMAWRRANYERLVRIGAIY